LSAIYALSARSVKTSALLPSLSVVMRHVASSRRACRHRRRESGMLQRPGHGSLLEPLSVDILVKIGVWAKETLGTDRSPSAATTPAFPGTVALEPASHATPSVFDERLSVLGRHHLTRRSANLVHSYLPKSAWKCLASSPKRLPVPGLRWSPYPPLRDAPAFHPP
jgi:hypothetical protein